MVIISCSMNPSTFFQQIHNKQIYKKFSCNGTLLETDDVTWVPEAQDVISLYEAFDFVLQAAFLSCKSLLGAHAQINPKPKFQMIRIPKSVTAPYVHCAAESPRIDILRGRSRVRPRPRALNMRRHCAARWMCRVDLVGPTPGGWVNQSMKSELARVPRPCLRRRAAAAMAAMAAAAAVPSSPLAGLGPAAAPATQITSCTATISVILCVISSN
jgi:hypothetical protein